MPIECQTLTVQETAALYGISRNTAYDLIHKGVIPSIKLGRKLLCPKQAVLAMLQAQPKDAA